MHYTFFTSVASTDSSLIMVVREHTVCMYDLVGGRYTYSVYLGHFTSVRSINYTLDLVNSWSPFGRGLISVAHL